MALIKISDISVDKAADSALDQNYLYKDLFLEVINRVSYNSDLHRSEIKDVQGLYDLDSIKNGIVNIFNTAPGQKILSPLFGIDLKNYLFEPINSFGALRLRRDIVDKLPKQEPRLELQRVTVEEDSDNQQYKIFLTIDVRSLNEYGITLESVLNSHGYSIL
jgi:phage baseplate assembly protein W